MEKRKRNTELVFLKVCTSLKYKSLILISFDDEVEVGNWWMEKFIFYETT